MANIPDGYRKVWEQLAYENHACTDPGQLRRKRDCKKSLYDLVELSGEYKENDVYVFANPMWLPPVEISGKCSGIQHDDSLTYFCVDSTRMPLESVELLAIKE